MACFELRNLQPRRAASLTQRVNETELDVSRYACASGLPSGLIAFLSGHKLAHSATLAATAQPRAFAALAVVFVIPSEARNPYGTGGRAAICIMRFRLRKGSGAIPLFARNANQTSFFDSD